MFQSITSKVQDALAKVNEVAEEACSSIKTVRSFAGEDSEVNRYSERLKTVYSLNIRNSFAYAGYIWSTQVCSYIHFVFNGSKFIIVVVLLYDVIFVKKF